MVDDERSVWDIAGVIGALWPWSSRSGYKDACNDRSPAAYWCTRSAGHYGRHVAHDGTSEVVDEWGNVLVSPSVALAELLQLEQELQSVDK